MASEQPFIMFFHECSNCYSKVWVKNFTDGIPQSFLEFVEYLVRTIRVPLRLSKSTYNAIEPHWRPYFLKCAVCDLNYHYIIQMESWNDDDLK